MKTLSLIFICLYGIAGTAMAQTTTAPESKTPERHKLSGFCMSGGAGYASLLPGSTGSISSNLQNYGFAPMASEMVCWDISPLHITARNVVVELSVNGLAKRNLAFGDSRTTTSGSGVRMELGYVLFHNNHCVLYPEAGMYLGNVDIHSHQGANPVQDVSGTNHFAAFDCSLNLDLHSHIVENMHDFVNTTTSPAKFFCSTLGITAGCSFSPFSTYWNDNNIDIYTKTSPNVNFLTSVIGNNTSAPVSIFYVKFRIGFGMMWKS